VVKAMRTTFAIAASAPAILHLNVSYLKEKQISFHYPLQCQKIFKYLIDKHLGRTINKNTIPFNN
jgi:hypothetical protein